MRSFQFILIDNERIEDRLKSKLEKKSNLYILKVAIVSLKVNYYFPLFLDDELNYDVTPMIVKPEDYIVKDKDLNYQCIRSYNDVLGNDVIKIFNNFMSEKVDIILAPPRTSYIRYCDICNVNISGDNFARHCRSTSHIKKICPAEAESEKYKCECGSIINKTSIKKHNSSIKHKNFILSKN